MSTHLTPDQLTLMDKLYWGGLNDREVSEKVGCRPPAVFHWRQRRDYPPNGVPGGGARNWYTVRLTESDELVAEGTAEECAKAMGTSVNSFHCIKAHVKAGRSKRYTFERKGLCQKST